MLDVIKLLERFFPGKCIICGIPTSNPICPECFSKIKPLESYCTKCGVALKSGTFNFCGECIDKTFHFENIHPIFHYKDVYPIITLFKYSRSIKAWRVVKDLTEQAIPRLNLKINAVDEITFIPVHWRRKFTREFNHAELLAKFVATRVNKPIKDYLKKTRNTPQQSLLSRRKRLSNVRNSFEIKGNPDGKRLLLVDDVATTLATLNEASRVLKKAGAEKITVLVFARA